jgi:hypothetical protein
MTISTAPAIPPGSSAADLFAAGADSGLTYATDIVHRVCCLAGSFNLIEDSRRNQDGRLLRRAITRHDTAALYDWLVEAFSYQGIADWLAFDYMQRHGSVSWDEIDQALQGEPACPKLGSYWAFAECRYHKLSRTCDEPEHIQACPLPRPHLRNGRLNQTAYSLFLFMRDIAGGDFVGWIEASLANAGGTSQPDELSGLREALIGPLRNVYGVADKVLAMSLSAILIAAGPKHPGWLETGCSMVAVDTLVHAFLHRTGILHGLGAQHPYGTACYQPGKCAEVITAVARRIDARQFNPAYPAVFPRFVQRAIWRYCAQLGLDVCNGNKINDDHRCDNRSCSLFKSCHRIS